MRAVHVTTKVAKGARRYLVNLGCIQGNSKYGTPTLSIDAPHCGGIRCLDANIVKTPYNYPKHMY
jgi:hypothetical protein